jgi:hypothetical protein
MASSAATDPNRYDHCSRGTLITAVGNSAFEEREQAAHLLRQRRDLIAVLHAWVEHWAIEAPQTSDGGWLQKPLMLGYDDDAIRIELRRGTRTIPELLSLGITTPGLHTIESRA